MSRFHRENPDQPISHDAFEGVRFAVQAQDETQVLRVKCVGGPKDGATLSFTGAIPNTFVIPRHDSGVWSPYVTGGKPITEKPAYGACVYRKKIHPEDGTVMFVFKREDAVE